MIGEVGYISDNVLYLLRGSLIYSMPVSYRKIMDDHRSWDQLWVEHFGRAGAIGYEYKLLNVKPMPQPRQIDYLDLSDLTFDLDKTIEYNRVKLQQRIDNLFSK